MKKLELIQNCSKHRSTVVPPPESPKGWLELDLSPEKEAPIKHEQLRTREIRNKNLKRPIFEKEMEEENRKKNDKKIVPQCPVCGKEYPVNILVAHAPVCANQLFDN